MSIVGELIAELGTVCAGLPDQRKTPPLDGDYTMADIGLSAFSLFFMGSPSFLAHQRALARGQGRSNCQTLFGMAAIPSDNYIRLMLDGASPAAFDSLFMRAIEQAGPLTRFQCLGGRVLIALDGTEYFCSRKISCPQCSTRRRSDGGVECFHAFLGATMVAPGHHQVLPLPPEFIAPQDGAEKQDCERSAAKRWLARHGRSVAHLRPIFLGDDLFACQPIATAIHQAGGNFILTCKPSSHQTITEYLHGAKLEEHRQTARKGRNVTTTIYRWLSGVPLRGSADAMAVNWFSIEIRNAAGKRTYYNSFVTDLPVTADSVAELAACGRARWKIENETFNVPEDQRLPPRAQFRSRQADARQRLPDPQPARLRLPYCRLARRARLASGRRCLWRYVPLLRGATNDHCLCRVRWLGPSAPVHRRGRPSAALTADRPPPPHSLPRPGDKPENVSQPSFRPSFLLRITSSA